MVIFDGEQPFESFYLKHFESFQDLQNCTECFKNLSIYSGSIYYQIDKNNTGSFKRILSENDSWLDETFWKNGGNNYTSSFILGTLNNNSLRLITSGSERFSISNVGNVNVSKSLNVIENVTITGSLNLKNVIYDNVLSSGSSTQFLRSISGGVQWSNISTSDITGLSTISSSFSSSISSLNNYTSSNTLTINNFSTHISSINIFTSSLNSYTSSNNTIINNFSVYTSSLNIQTGSFFKQGGNSFGQSGSFGLNDSNNLHIKTNNLIRMFVSSSGQIGIGTVNPIANLTTVGAYTIGSNIPSSWANIIAGRNAIVNNNRAFYFDITGATPYAELSTYKYDDSTTFPIILQGNGGNILIGTITDSGYKLDVNGTLRNTTSAYFATTSGNVLIGTTTDSGYKLNVNGSGKFFETTIDSSYPLTSVLLNGVAKYYTGVANGTDVLITGTVSGDAIHRTTGGKMLFSTNNGSTSALTILSNGNVGIGTTTPSTSAKLDITSTTSGVLFPRMTTTQKNSITGVAGLVLYDTTLSKLQVYTTTWESLH